MGMSAVYARTSRYSEELTVFRFKKVEYEKNLQNQCSTVYIKNSLIAVNFMCSCVSTLSTTGESKREHCESAKALFLQKMTS